MDPVTLLTAEEYARLPDLDDGTKDELVRGRVVRYPLPGFRHGVCCSHVGSILGRESRARPPAVATMGSGVIVGRNPDSVLAPDVAVWSRMPPMQEPDGWPEVAPDLVAEVSDSRNDFEYNQTKAAIYLQAGVRMVWLIDPADRVVWVYRGPDEARVLHEGATVGGDDVLPGITRPVAELFG